MGLVAAAIYYTASCGRSIMRNLTAQIGLTQRLGHVAERSVIHAFCCTDLVTGMPLVLSSRESRVLRRVDDAAGGTRVAVHRQPQLPLAAIVRASAAFPGIPPMSFKLPPDAGSQRAARRALCADGGIWSNLGTQGIDDEPDLAVKSVVCVNASAPAKPMRPGLCRIPGVALVVAVVRSTRILNRNTVEPRIEAINHELARWAAGLDSQVRVGPTTVVADMRPIKESIDALRQLPRELGLDRLIASEWCKRLVDRDTPQQVRTKTKLSKISEPDAAALLLRGYVNTWLASLTIVPFRPNELDNKSVEDVAARLDRMVAIKKPAAAPQA